MNSLDLIEALEDLPYKSNIRIRLNGNPTYNAFVHDVRMATAEEIAEMKDNGIQTFKKEVVIEVLT